MRFRGIAAALVTGTIATAFLTLWMHAPDFIAVGIGATMFVFVLASAGGRGEQLGIDSDLAWQKVAPDLPPLSDRATIERQQARIGGPAGSRTGSRAARGRARTAEGLAALPATGARPTGRPTNSEEPPTRV